MAARPPHCLLPWPREPLWPSRFRLRRAVEEADDAAPEILSDHLTQGANLGAGFEKWTPDSGETIGQRLGAIVGGAMGYEPEDLPWEVPLIELGLDSLMAVRIKNRVEYDFDLPPIQLTAVRDANLYAVEKLIEYAIEHRDEVEELAEHQKTQTAEEIAAAQAELMGGATTVAELEEKLADSRVAAPEPPETRQRPADRSVGPRRSRRRRRTRQAREASCRLKRGPRVAAQVLTQEAVTEALGSDVPPREAAERVTFATWAIVLASLPAASSTRCPSSTTRPPRRWRRGSPNAPKGPSPSRT